jgi:hypothetical protein
MKRSPIAVALAAATMALPAAADPPRTETKSATSAAVPAQAMSPERLARMRRHLLSQIAVYDAGEAAMRSPTPAEAAALANTAEVGNGPVLALPSGGLAMRADAASLSFLIVDLQADGKRALRHEAASKGGAHGR